MKNPSRQSSRYIRIVLCLLGAAAFPAAAQLIWQGDTDTEITNTDNWDVAPAFDGTEALKIGDFSLSGRTLNLATDISALRLDIGDGAAVNPVAVINGSGQTVTLSKSGVDNNAPTFWFRTSDNRRIDFNPNILFDAGVGSGSYTAHFREQNNSSGGLNVYGNITQAAGESWEIATNKASSRGVLRLYGQNDVDKLRVNGMDIQIGNVGAAGNAELVFNGGGFLFDGDRYTDAISNDMSMLSAATLSGQLRVTGNVNQGSQSLTLNGGATQIMRFETASMTGTGTTTINTANFTVATMDDISNGALILGANNSNSADTGVLILGGGDVPTAAQFAADRSYNNAGGANTWRLSTPNIERRGGAFAARGSDLVITSGWTGIDSTTFDRNFGLGSAATLDGDLYANGAVRIEQDIAYTGTQRIITGSGPAAQVLNEGWQLNGAPVNEIAGAITGPASGDFILAVLSGNRQGTHGSTGGTGVIRFSNTGNDLSAANASWLIGGARSGNTYLPSGRTVVADNGWDNGGAVAIFTDDLAFGGADEVVVRGGGSSGTNNGGVLLFENRDGGEKTFARDFIVHQNDANAKAAFGSYAGNVRHTGAITQNGGGNDVMVHVESGQLRWDGASFTNNMTAGGDHEIRKNGGGLFVVEQTSVFGGTFTGNYDLYVREGSVIWNKNDVGFDTVTVSSGATLGGSGLIDGNTTIAGMLSPGNSPGLLTIDANLTLQGTSTSFFEINGATRETQYDAVDVGGNLVYGGILDVLFGYTPAVNDTFQLFNVTGSSSGDFASVNIQNAGWEGTFDSSTGSLTLTVIPEPGTLALLGFSLLALLAARRFQR